MHLVFEEVCKYVKVIPLHQFRPVRCDRTLQMSDINVRLFEFGTVNMLIRQIFNLAIFFMPGPVSTFQSSLSLLQPDRQNVGDVHFLQTMDRLKL